MNLHHAHKQPGYQSGPPRLEPMAVPMARYQRRRAMRRAIRREAWQMVTLFASLAALWCGLKLDSDAMAVAGMCLCGVAAMASYKLSERG